jgi:hypothetical protein
MTSFHALATMTGGYYNYCHWTTRLGLHLDAQMISVFGPNYQARPPCIESFPYKDACLLDRTVISNGVQRFVGSQREAIRNDGLI